MSLAGEDAGTTQIPATKLVEFESVTKRFPGVLANDAVSFALHPGEVHVLLGENGAGKSTLIGMLAGMQQPDSGVIRVQGRAGMIVSPARALAAGIGTVFQHGMLVPSLTVAQNLALGGRWWRRPGRAAVSARLAEICTALGLQVAPDAIVGELSLGEQQQVEIIRALWRGGKVLVLDEPTAMLAPPGIAALGLLMRRMAATGIGIVFITHKLDEALDFADRITVLRAGRISGALAPETLKTMPRATAIETIIGLMFATAAPATNKPDRVIRKLVQANAPVLQVIKAGMNDARGRHVLRDISFSVQAGEIFGLAGIDGNGQRELAELLAGQAAGTGTVMLDGQDISGLDVAARSRLGLRYVTDDRLGEGTERGFPVSLNLLLKQIGSAPFWRFGLAQDRLIDQHATDLVRKFDIRTPSIDTPIGRLSGGNIQKALLARELSGSARAVIYCKPTYGLDLQNIEAARARILQAAATGIATILISTDMDEIIAMSDRIGVMVSGNLCRIIVNQGDARAEAGRLMAGLGSEATQPEAAYVH
jgi:simple sugar transport system ATP-binding protein